MTAPIAVIAGTGFYSLAALDSPSELTVETRFGTAKCTKGSWHGREVIFLTRHGATHSVPPHQVNYRANIQALADLGVEEVLAVNVVGGVSPELAPGSIVVLSDFLDFTKSRPVTFFEGDTPEGVVHTDMTNPYDLGLRAELIAAAARVGVTVTDGGVYACFEGPRFESAAEIRMCQLLGASVVGMTGVPEVTLAKELGLKYATLSLVVNPATGLSEEPITMEELNLVLAAGANRVWSVISETVQSKGLAQ